MGHVASRPPRQEHRLGLLRRLAAGRHKKIALFSLQPYTIYFLGNEIELQRPC